MFLRTASITCCSRLKCALTSSDGVNGIRFMASPCHARVADVEVIAHNKRGLRQRYLNAARLIWLIRLATAVLFLP
jgi:hypothetical protein